MSTTRQSLAVVKNASFSSERPPSSTSSLSHPALITKGAFLRAMDSLRQKRFPAHFVKKSSLIPRSKSLHFSCEIKVDDEGFCAIVGYDAQNQVSETFHIVGPNISCEILHSVPPSFVGNGACVVVRGPDLKRVSKQMSSTNGELYVLAPDSGIVSLIKTGIVALSKASLPPLGQCRWWSVLSQQQQQRKEEEIVTTKRSFSLSKVEQVQLSRAVAAITSCFCVLSVPPVLSVEEALLVLNSHQDRKRDSWEVDMVSAGVVSLLGLLASCRVRPIPFASFSLFCKTSCESVEDSIHACQALLRDIHSDHAVSCIQQVTRALQHLNQLWFTKQAGALLVEGFSPQVHEISMLAFLSHCIKHRDRVFVKRMAFDLPPPPTSSSSLTSSSTVVVESSSSSPSTPVVEPTTAVQSSEPVLQVPEPLEQEPLPSSNLVILQTDLDALRRLSEYLSHRVQEETDPALLSLLREELHSVEGELLHTAHLPTATTTSSSPLMSSVPLPALCEEEESEEEDDEDDNTTDSQNRFVALVLALWVESRQEPLMKQSVQQAKESHLLLSHILQQVRDLTSRVGDFPELQRYQNQKQTALALISLLEENVLLRLQVLTQQQQ